MGATIVKKYFAILLFVVLFSSCRYLPDTSITGFQASDWNSDGTVLYAANSNKIYKSIEGGVDFHLWYTLPDDPNAWTNFGKTFALMIPARMPGETTDSMLVSWMGSNKLYLCKDISREPPVFTPVVYDDHQYWYYDVDDGGAIALAEDSSGNLYAAWYHLEYGSGANLYKSTDRGVSWTIIKSLDTRHLHAVKVNPYNNWLYIIGGEGLDPDASEANHVLRSKDGGNTWTTIYNSSPYDQPKFTTMEFINNTVLMGEDVNGSPGSSNSRIFSFVDDGGSTPFSLTTRYTGESTHEIWHATKMSGTIYFASGSNPASATITVRCLSTTDGINFTQLQSKKIDVSHVENCDLGILTYHPDRRNDLIYSLSYHTGYKIKGP